MLFVFDEPRYPSFYMLNTLIPLDIIFLDGSGRVVEIAADAEPCPAEPCPHFSPRQPAAAVLELNGGAAALHAVEPGSFIEVRNVGSYPLTPAGDG
jgi:uncharacterized membrane protein (UPF0127 family)